MSGERFPRLLVCEGDKDRLFFHHFIEVRKLPRFHIIAANGKDRFAEAIRAYQILPKSNYPSIGEILIVGDNDDLPDKRFEDIKKQINDLYPGTAPDKPLQRSRKSPYCTVLMLPRAGIHGTLEAVVKEAAKASHKPDAAHVQTFLDNCGVDRWGSITRQEKAWLRAMLAVRCKDPFVPLGNVFRDHQDIISLTHKSLDYIEKVLATFAPAKGA